MRVERFSLSLARPLDTARGRIDAREGVLVWVTDAEMPGVGETTPLPGWTEGRDEAFAALAAADAETPLSALDRTPAARHGLATARLDAAARRASESLAARLAGATRRPADTVPVNATIGDDPPDETAARAREAVDEGFDCLKIKVGARPVADDTKRLRAVREAAPDATLRADANGAIAAVADHGVDLAYVEQPLPADDLAGHRRLRETTETPVALDESLAEFGVDEVRSADAADVVVLKPMALGGPDRAVTAAKRAHEVGVDAVVTTTVDAVVARTAAVHVAAAIPNDLACGLATGSLLTEDLYPDPAPVKSGSVAVPDDPGLAGATFD